MSFFIIYPGGDRSKLKPIELSEALEYELTDYAVASRHKFNDVKTASKYVRDLAVENGKEFIPLTEDGNDYLD